MEDSPTEVTQWLVELTQDAAGHTNVAWPHDDDGGLLRLENSGENLVWTRPRTREVVTPPWPADVIKNIGVIVYGTQYFVTSDGM